MEAPAEAIVTIVFSTLSPVEKMPYDLNYCHHTYCNYYHTIITDELLLSPNVQ